MLVGVGGDWTRNPWVDSQVFYHWAEFPYGQMDKWLLANQPCDFYIQSVQTLPG